MSRQKLSGQFSSIETRNHPDPTNPVRFSISPSPTIRNAARWAAIRGAEFSNHFAENTG